MSRTLLTLWVTTLLATVLGIVPFLVAKLRRALAAARQIEAYTAGMLAGGVGIANHTARVADLKESSRVASGLLVAASSIERHIALIKGVLMMQGRSDGRVKEERGSQE